MPVILSRGCFCSYCCGILGIYSSVKSPLYRMQGAVRGISDLGVPGVLEPTMGISVVRPEPSLILHSDPSFPSSSWRAGEIPYSSFHIRVLQVENPVLHPVPCVAFVLLAHSKPCCPVFIWWFLDILPFWTWQGGLLASDHSHCGLGGSHPRSSLLSEGPVATQNLPPSFLCLWSAPHGVYECWYQNAEHL